MEINRYHHNSPVKIITTHLGIPQDYKKRCIQEVYKIGDQQSYTTNVKAIMSSYKVWEETKVFNPLFNRVLEIIKDLDPIQSNYHFNLVNAWSAIYKKGNHADRHHHLPSNYSWIYYLKTPPNSSPLIFNDINFELIIEDDLFVIFPSHLVHSVPSHSINEDRICLAGNLVWNTRDSFHEETS